MTEQAETTPGTGKASQTETATKSGTTPQSTSRISGFWAGLKDELPFFVLVIGGIVSFRVFLFDMNYIPSESMQPALEVGDRIVVNKFAYGYSRYTVPFGLLPSIGGEDGRLFGSVPDRGDVITFKHPRTGVIFIKRVVGLPGDRIQYAGGRLFVNGEAAPREKITNFDYRAHKGGVVNVDVIREELPDGTDYQIFERFSDATLDNAGPFVVPEGHVFVMGDNRDNSVDSRNLRSGVGYLPLENIVGRADRVLFSTYRCKRETDLHCAKRHLFGAIR